MLYEKEDTETLLYVKGMLAKQLNKMPNPSPMRSTLNTIFIDIMRELGNRPKQVAILEKRQNARNLARNKDRSTAD